MNPPSPMTQWEIVEVLFKCESDTLCTRHVLQTRLNEQEIPERRLAVLLSDPRQPRRAEIVVAGHDAAILQTLLPKVHPC